MTVTRLTPANDIQMVVAGEIRAWMGRRNVTQTALAAAMGISQSQISKRLNGAIPFDIVELDQIASYLGVEVAVLVGGRPGSDGDPNGPNGGLATGTYPIIGLAA